MVKTNCNFVVFACLAVFVRSDMCDVPNKCEISKYRSIDGSCNNLEHPEWGKSMTGYKRLLPVAFADGISEPRKSVRGNPLPDARYLSRTLFTDSVKNDKMYTVLAMQFGQFLSHDMSHVYGVDPDPSNPTCCNHDFTQTRRFEKQTGIPCMGQSLNQYDPIFVKYGQRCMDFSRGRIFNCTKDSVPRTLTVPSHFLDGSNVYGNDEKEAKMLRQMKGGRMRVVGRGVHYPPNKESCLRNVCFLTGDPERSDQTVGLASIHIIMLREHNRVARILEQLNPHWSDQILYQEARRIVIAEIQHISYKEWISEYIGKKRAKELGVFDHNAVGYSNRYNPKINPNVYTEYAHSIMRCFHSNIKGRLSLRSTFLGLVLGKYRLNDFTYDPEILTIGDNTDNVLYGMASEAQQTTGVGHSPEITQDLFRKNGGRFGFDLKTIDILRERSEGIAGYNAHREFCGLRVANNFEDLREEIDLNLIEKLKQVYESPDDIDLTVGASLETLMENAELGPTGMCIFIRQFNETRNSDRFFYDHGGHKGAFTLPQLWEIRKATMSRILCDNTKIWKIQKKAFTLGGTYSNMRVSCSIIPRVDLTHWKERPSYI